MTQVNIDIENENLFFTQKRWAHDNFMGTVLKVKEGILGMRFGLF